MWNGIIVILIVAVIIGTTIIIARHRRTEPLTSPQPSAKQVAGQTNGPNEINQPIAYYRPVVLAEDFDMTGYHELADNSLLLSTASQLIPAAVNAISAVASSAAQAANQGAFQVILQAGQELSKSTAGEDLYRAMTHLPGEKVFAGQANLKPISATSSEIATKTGAVASVMSLVAMAVGQYYMTEINGKLEHIDHSVEQIRNFQNIELMSSVRSVIRETKHVSQYQDEIVMNDSERRDARVHVRELEESAGKLLDQLNALILSELTEVTKYSEYERQTREIFPLVSAQHAVVATLTQLSQLVMVLSNGVVSAQRAGATVADFDDKVEHVQSAVRKWHEKYVNQFSVDLALSQRRKTGINKLVSQPFTRIKAQLAFQTVSPEFVKQVKSECEVQNPVLPETAGYSQPVDLLINNGHVYYKVPINNTERVQADKLTTR